MADFVDFLIVGDPHCDGLPSFLPDDLRKNAFRMVVEQAIDYCVQHDIRHMIWLGDVFNGYPPAMDAMRTVIELDQRMHEEGIQLYIIDGNHGFVKKGETSLSLLSSLSRMGKIHAKIYTGDGAVEDVEGVCVAFLPWPHKDVSHLDRPSLVCAHVDRAGAKLANGRVMEGAEDFPLGEHTWVIGHNHTPQNLFVGAPLPLRWGDHNRRRFWHVRMNVNTGRGKRKSVLIDNPYNLEDLYVESDSDLLALDERTENTWTRLLLGRDMLGRSREIQKAYERVVCQPVPHDGQGEGEDGSPAATVPVTVDKETFADHFIESKIQEEGMDEERIKVLRELVQEAKLSV